MSSSQIVIITDRPALGHAIARTLRYCPPLPHRVECWQMTYEQQSLFLTYERLQEAELFILELLRTYENGIRAEGIAAAARLATLARKRSLIVSCYALGREVQSPRYWDMGSLDSLVERTAQLLSADVDGPLSDLDEIAALFPGMLAVPEQH